MSSAQTHKERYVEKLNLAGLLFSPEVESSFRKVEFHRFMQEFFVPDGPDHYRTVSLDPVSPDPEALECVYSGEPIVVSIRSGSFDQVALSAGTVATMLENLELEPGAKVLEVGSNVGYLGALIAEIVGTQSSVTLIDARRSNISQVKRNLVRAGYPKIAVHIRDGFYGWRHTAPFDRILVSVGCVDLSPHWVDQLSPHGFILMPMIKQGWIPLIRVWAENGAVLGRIVASAGAAIDQIRGECQSVVVQRLCPLK